jgi:hypothetical protein
VRVLEGPGGRGAILPGLRAQVVVETRTGGHRLGVEVSGERAVLYEKRQLQLMKTSVRLEYSRCSEQQLSPVQDIFQACRTPRQMWER